MVLGLGASGMAAARLLVREGAVVNCSESEDGKEIERRALELERIGCRVERGGHTEEFAGGAELVVISPGVAPSLPVVRRMVQRGVPVISEIELAYRFCACPIIAVTGTNGKTTAVTLLERVLKEAGKNAMAAGNIGRPFSDLMESGRGPEIAVIEVSSFQLEGVRDFRPWIAVALNVADDHLDRYGTFDDYVRAKAMIFRNQGAGDWAVIREEDREMWGREGVIGAQSVMPFSAAASIAKGAYVEEDALVLARKGEMETVCGRGEVRLIGDHNIENALAVAAAASICGVDAGIVRGVLREFKGLPHRMEIVGSRQGVRFINDSKATNPDAVRRALQAVGERVILIAGGRDKGFDYTVLREEVSKRVKAVIFIGEAGERMKRMIGDVTESYLEGSLGAAVHRAVRIASPGDTVMLSPACSSFDMFRNFEDRGDKFKEIVKRLSLKRRL